jgi:hypothetical protein
MIASKSPFTNWSPVFIFDAGTEFLSICSHAIHGIGCNCLNMGRGHDHGWCGGRVVCTLQYRAKWYRRSDALPKAFSRRDTCALGLKIVSRFPDVQMLRC